MSSAATAANHIGLVEEIKQMHVANSVSAAASFLLNNTTEIVVFLNGATRPGGDGGDNKPPQEPKWNHPLLGILLTTITLITIFGNLLVICAVIRERCLKSVTYYFIVSLAVADLIVGLVVMPFSSLNNVMTNNFWFFGDIW